MVKKFPSEKINGTNAYPLFSFTSSKMQHHSGRPGYKSCLIIFLEILLDTARSWGLVFRK